MRTQQRPEMASKSTPAPVANRLNGVQVGHIDSQSQIISLESPLLRRSLVPGTWEGTASDVLFWEPPTRRRVPTRRVA